MFLGGIDLTLKTVSSEKKIAFHQNFTIDGKMLTLIGTSLYTERGSPFVLPTFSLGFLLLQHYFRSSLILTVSTCMLPIVLSKSYLQAGKFVNLTFTALET